MGWASGSEVAVDMINSLRKNMRRDVEGRKAVYRDLIQSLTSMDWDTIDEAMGYDPVFDEIVKEMFPNHFDDYDDD